MPQTDENPYRSPSEAGDESRGPKRWQNRRLDWRMPTSSAWPALIVIGGPLLIGFLLFLFVNAIRWLTAQ
jgi:hypothetical protein